MAVNREIYFETLKNLLTKSASSFVFINGPADCGKTTLLHSIQEIKGLSSSIYIDSLECITMTILYERLLTFFASNVPGNRSSIGSKRSASAAASAYKPCSTVTEMVTRLSAMNWPDNYKIVLLIDEAERLFQLDSNSFSVILRLPEMFNYKISLVMTSREQFDDFGPAVTGGLIPLKITLPSFSTEETREIICEQLQTEEIDANKIEKCVKIVQQVANATVKELSVLKNLTASILHCKPNINNNIKLPKMVQERLDASNRLDSYYKQTISSLSLIEKYLLISAYIASFQSGREDVKIFGSAASSGKRKASKQFNPAKDSNNTKNVDKLTVQLPKLFDQTRLIAIFYFLSHDIETLPSPQQLQLNIKSLCDRGLLKFSGNSGTKIDSLKYRVNISRDFALNVAELVKQDLNQLIISSN